MLKHAAIVLSLVGSSFAFADTACKADNCARAVTGTRNGASQLAQATLDCVSFLAQPTINHAQTTLTVTSTTKATITISKRDVLRPIPTYATACTDDAQYSSACSCLGVHPTANSATYSTTTTTTTLTLSTTTTLPSSTTSPYPTCTPHPSFLTDPLNCGVCNHICATGICTNGVCTSSQCPSNQTCSGGFKTCGSSNCFCFSDAGGRGFCGTNAVCTGLVSCAGDGDCGKGTGLICALNTCCTAPSKTKPGICLSGECANPAKKLMRLARMAEGGDLGMGVDTAAWVGRG